MTSDGLRDLSPPLQGVPRDSPLDVNLYVACGGSGSTELCNRLALFADEVQVRPDLVYYDSDRGLRLIRDSNPLPFIPPMPYGMTNSLASIYRRFGRIAWVLCNPALPWSHHEMPPAAYLIRHPVHAFASWIKPERHADTAANYGGPDGVLDRWCTWWLDIARDYIRGRWEGRGHLLRYEHMISDAAGLELRDHLDGWDSDRRNDLDPVLATRIRHLTEPEVLYLYGRWDV